MVGLLALLLALFLVGLSAFIDRNIVYCQIGGH